MNQSKYMNGNLINHERGRWKYSIGSVFFVCCFFFLFQNASLWYSLLDLNIIFRNLNLNIISEWCFFFSCVIDENIVRKRFFNCLIVCSWKREEKKNEMNFGTIIRALNQFDKEKEKQSTIESIWKISRIHPFTQHSDCLNGIQSVLMSKTFVNYLLTIWKFAD